jgi:tight adherence protein C
MLSPSPHALMLSGLAAVILLGAVLLLVRDGSVRRLERRVDAFVIGETAAAAGGIAGLDLIAGVGERIRRGTKLYSQRDLDALTAVLQASGMEPRRALPILLGSKALLLVLMPLLALAYGAAAGLAPFSRILMCGIALPIGLLGPEWLIGHVRGKHLKKLQLGLPDALDLMVVCTEAGMGLETAVEHVAREMELSNPPMSVSLATFLDELRMLPDRREAFANFGSRFGLAEMQRTATMLSQSQRYGTPLAQALRAIAGELRRERLVRIEERAVKLPALLIFPLILFIMPALFIILVGPAMIKVMGSLHALAH